MKKADKQIAELKAEQFVTYIFTEKIKQFIGKEMLPVDMIREMEEYLLEEYRVIANKVMGEMILKLGELLEKEAK